MNKYFFLPKYELKNLLRDRMNLMLFVYPLLMLAFSVWLFPILISTPELQNTGLEVTVVIILIALLGLGNIVAAALLGFSLLDNKDEDTMQTIAVTPISKTGYVNFKVVYTFLFSILSNFVLLGGTKLLASAKYVVNLGSGEASLFAGVSYLHILLFSISASLLVPALGLIIVGLSKNKVEGFAYMKSTGFIMLIPMLILLPSFQGAGQYILGIFPNFWGVQAMINLMLPELFSNSANLSFYLYLIYGAVIAVVYSLLSYKFYMKRSG